jgi:hypothetical protein
VPDDLNPNDFLGALVVKPGGWVAHLSDEAYSGTETEAGTEMIIESSYTFPMRRYVALLSLALLIGASNAFAADPRLADGVSGAPVAWTDWVAKRGPVAVLVWSSWSPDAEAAMDGYEALAAACADAGLHLVVLDVQETLEEGRAALGSHDVGWLHDRHGALLKQYRVIHVPSLLLVDADGNHLAKMGATPEAVRGWRTP